MGENISAEKLYDTLSSLLSSEYFDTVPERFQSIRILEQAIKEGNSSDFIIEKMKEYKTCTQRNFLPRLSEMIANKFWNMDFEKRNSGIIKVRKYDENADYIRRR